MYPKVSLERYPNLREFRVNFVDSLKVELNSYFPEGSYAIFDCFDPKELPSDPAMNHEPWPMIPTYALKIMTLAKRFGTDEVETSNQFDEFLTEILNYDEVSYCNHKAV